MTRANGCETRIFEDALGRVVRQEEQDRNRTLVIEWTWEADRPSRQVTDGVTRDLSWDDLGRLTGCSDTGETYTWDSADERASANGLTYERDAAGRLSFDGVYDYSYDTLGRRTLRASRTDADDRDVYSWGAGGKLISVAHGPAGSEVEVAHYAYDGSGRLVSMVDAGGETRIGYLPDSDRPVRFLTPAGAEWHLVHALPLAAYSAAIAADGRERYMHTDPFGRVLAVSDASGDLTPIAEDCFGLRLSDPGLDGPDVSLHGQIFHSASGLLLTGARPYDPRVGEFLAPDPLGLEAAPTVYGYAAGNPILAQDPGGRLFTAMAAAVLAGAVILNEIRKFAQSDDAKRTKNSYKRMGEVAEDDNALGEAEKGHKRLSRTAKRGGQTALKSTKKAYDTFCSPAENAKDLAEGAGDLAESIMEEGTEGGAKEVIQ